jgi:hypothetical protein
VPTSLYETHFTWRVLKVDNDRSNDISLHLAKPRARIAGQHASINKIRHVAKKSHERSSPYDSQYQKH